MTRYTSFALLAFASLVFVAGVQSADPPAVYAGEDNVLQTYKKRFTKDAYLSDKEEILKALVTAGGPAARDALGWCTLQARAFQEQAAKDAEKVFTKFKAAEEAYSEQFESYAKQQEKQGKPRPTSHPANWPSRIKFDEAQADMFSADKAIAESATIVESARRAYGEVLDTFAEGPAEKLRADLAGGPLASKDWAVRAEQYDLLGFATATWALRLLQDAAVSEADPRALTVVLDSLGGRDPAQVLPILIARLSDERWTIRAAALAAMARTPSKETVDAVLARYPLEEGRLRGDCVRVLVALTGGDCADRPEAWKQWWALNRDTWTGAPPKADPSKDTPEKIAKDAAKRMAKEASQTGFFGIEVKSRRLVFVIDLSGSMNEKSSDKSDKSRAELAKPELIRVIRALDDGDLFSVVLYSSDVRVWRPEMTVADAETRKSAAEFVEKSAIVGGTATYDALVAGLQLGDVGKGKAKGADATGDGKLDTVLLLSDGRPSVGRYTDGAQIRTAIKELNRTRRIAIHTIAFGKDADEKFMEGLALDNGGTYLKL